MLWADEAGHSRRPIVAIEDHLYHTAEMLDAVAGASAADLRHFSVCVLDVEGPDTRAALAEWPARFPGVQIVTLKALGTR